VGTPPPTHAEHAKEWLANNDPSGWGIEVEPAKEVANPPLVTGGALEEIEAVLQQFPAQRQVAFRKVISGSVPRKLKGETLTGLKQARVASRGVAVITHDNCHLLDFGMVRFPGRHDEGTISQYVHHGYLPRLQKVEGTLGVLSYGWSSSNYFHFLLEAIPKLRLFAKAGVSYDKLYAPMARPYHHELLSLFGVDTKQVIPESYYAHVQADVVQVPSHQQLVREEQTRFLFETAARHPWSKVKQEPRKRIYISRGRTKIRNCVNENQFMPQLERLGFQRYYLETMSVREQIELFQQADVIMGPHGAGLANMVFAPAGTQVIELATPYRPYDCFAQLAASCGHPFYWHFAQPVDGNRETEESNLWVDGDNLIDSLHEHEIVGKPGSAPLRRDKTPRRQIVA